MTSEYEMQSPFTTKNEILDWETHYIENLTEKRQHEEQNVIDIIEKVKARQTSKTPKGYLLTAELREMAQWKSHYVPSKIDKNPQGLIEDVTGEAFSLDNDWEKIEKLKK